MVRAMAGLAMPRLLVVLVLLGMLAAGCSTQKPLSKDEVDARAQEYYQRGMDLYQKGDFRGALESFRLAKAYDIQGSNASIVEMIDKTEQKLRIPGAGSAAARNPAPPPPQAAPQPTAARPAPSDPAPANPAPTLVPAPTSPPSGGGGQRLDATFKTYRSYTYPYSIEIPESWGLGPEQPQISGIPVEVLAAPETGGVPTDIGLLAVPLPADVDARAWFEAMRKGVRMAGVDPTDIGKRPVDGAEAFLMRATANDRRGKHVSTMAMFEIERVGWLIIFSAPADQSDRLQPLFHRMLDSFHSGKQSRVV